MKYRFLLLLSGLLLLSSRLTAQNPQVGLVLVVEGGGQLQRNGETLGLRMADALFAGDRLEVKAGSTSFLFCPQGELVRASEGARILFAADSYQLEAGPQPVAEGGRKCTLPKVALGAESLERVGGLRARGYPPIVVYVGGLLSATRPVFQWEPLDEAERYEIRIKDPRGRVLMERSTLDREWQPETDLAPGPYHWEILGYKGSEAVGQQQARFVIEPADLGQPASDNAADLILQATLLENQGYYSEAANYYRRLRDLFPDDRRFTSRLAWLYWNSGLITAANIETEKLGSGQD